MGKLNIFIGDNGSGKSTLVETNACKINLPLIGDYIKEVKDFEATRVLKAYAVNFYHIVFNNDALMH